MKGVEGEAVEDVVMYYRPDGTATVVGLWHSKSISQAMRFTLCAPSRL